ncbi:MAG: TerD family protein [Muribaculaceae bacterium]|nr:TerD family protein [Muribaculaceae bacterium]
MAINLKKESPQEISFKKFIVGLGWDINELPNEDFDLDVSAFLIGANGKVLTDDYMVFYNSEKRLKADDDGNLIPPVKIVPSSHWRDNSQMRSQSRPTDPEISVIGSIDLEEGGEERLDIDLSNVRSDVHRIIICASIYDACNRRQNFGRVENAYIRICQEGKTGVGQETYRYDLTEDFSTSKSVEFVQLRRTGSQWEVEALGIGHKGELDELVSLYVG